MYTELSLWLSLVFVVAGLCALAWSANLFVDAAGRIASALGVNPFVVGMVIIGFGTSAPELCVSALSGLSGHSDVSLGNAYGSCIFNIAAILGVSALIRPLVVKPSVTFAAVPALVAISLFSCLLVGAGSGFTRQDGLWHLGLFAVLLPLYCWFDQRGKKKTAAAPSQTRGERLTWKAWASLFAGLAVLIGSSHVLVWGAVNVARSFGVSELMIGLTIVAVGTSLPELASAVVSARKGEDEFVLGNIIGSNFFNTLAVVGLAGSISPFHKISPYVLWRDLPVMVLLSLSIAFFGVNPRRPKENGVINRAEGMLWLLAFAVYLGVMVMQETKGA